MTIYFFSKGDKSIPSSRYRAYFLADELSKLGYSAKVYPLYPPEKNPFLENIKSFFQYLKLLRSIDKEDKIVLQRTIYNKYFYLAALFARIFFGKKFIFDFDDAIFVHSFLKTVIMVKLAEKVTCGGYFVLDWAKKYNPNSFYLPDAIPTEFYFPFTKNYKIKNSSPLIGWVGDGSVHFENLRFFKKILESLIKEGIKFQFKLIGAKNDKRIYSLFSSLPGLEVEIIDWINPENVAREIQKFDIGVMPLVGNDWNRAKYFKTLEYMACAVPPVASGFGENKFIIKNGENGFLADTTDEWCEKIKLLLSDKNLRERLGKRAQANIRGKFSLQQIARQFLNLVVD